MKTWDEIANQVAKVERKCKEWETDPETPVVDFELQETRAISQKLDRAWSELHDTVCGPDIDPEAYKLVMALDAWIDEVDRFRDSMSANPGGTDELWKSWANVLTYAKKKPVAKMLEGISYLTRVQKCSPAQIAKIYEWKDEFGQPDTRKVLAAIESGNDDPTVSPHWKREVKATSELWEARTSRLRQKKREPQKEITSDRPVIAPESLDTLLEQNVPSRQIARMKNIDQQTVIDYAREIGSIVDGQTPPPTMNAEQHLSKLRQAENIKLEAAREHSKEQQSKNSLSDGPDTYQQLGNYKEQVRQMAFDNCTKQEILQGLKPQYPDKCKPGSVAQIMAAMDREVGASQE
tara:strand:- start:3088 stop:4134 length:1047 start_codon:yes stop_codon:yes gene_type:complete